MTLSPSLVVVNQSIGVASKAQGFQGVDGILGVGPTDLTQGTVSGQEMVPTVTDNLFSQGAIANASLGIFYQPTTEEGALNGELTFGGVDESKCATFFLHCSPAYIHAKNADTRCRITGDVTYVPITSTAPASNYWGIDQNLSYGDGGETLLSGSAGIVDTGTTLLMIATDAFQKYEKATGAKMDSTTGLLKVTEQQLEKMQSLYFNIGTSIPLLLAYISLIGPCAQAARPSSSRRTRRSGRVLSTRCLAETITASTWSSPTWAARAAKASTLSVRIACV